MADDAFEFWIHPDRRAGVAVYAVAMGDWLGMDLDDLRRLRAAVETSTLTGSEELDTVLRFLHVSYNHNGLGRLSNPSPALAASPPNVARVEKAYFAVAPLIQPLSWESP